MTGTIKNVSAFGFTVSGSADDNISNYVFPFGRAVWTGMLCKVTKMGREGRREAKKDCLETTFHR